MPSDAHCHPYDLLAYEADAETIRRNTNTAIAASAWNTEEYQYHAQLARAASVDGAPPVRLCFGIHPQLPRQAPEAIGISRQTLETLCMQKQIDAIGEIGFDLYDEGYRSTEQLQEELFEFQLALALTKDLPVVLHVRRAMHKVFAYSQTLRRLKAVVFHSYSGTLEEAKALLKRGISAWFSFGSPIMLNHKTAINACARLPVDRLLFETDAPYQPLRGKQYTEYQDLPSVIRAAAEIRSRVGSEGGSYEALIDRTDANFYEVFGYPHHT
ncbi:MAG: TatD family hydrolase [Termitinemataceae bacterium]